MAKYNVEFKRADSEGYIQTRRIYQDVEGAAKEAQAMLNMQGDFEFLIIKRIKEKPAPILKTTKEVSK